MFLRLYRGIKSENLSCEMIPEFLTCQFQVQCQSDIFFFDFRVVLNAALTSVLSLHLCCIISIGSPIFHASIPPMCSLHVLCLFMIPCELLFLSLWLWNLLFSVALCVYLFVFFSLCLLFSAASLHLSPAPQFLTHTCNTSLILWTCYFASSEHH